MDIVTEYSFNANHTLLFKSLWSVKFFSRNVFTEDALNWSKSIYISNKRCYLDFLFIKQSWKNWYISEGSYDTEDWNIDAENVNKFK